MVTDLSLVSVECWGLKYPEFQIPKYLQWLHADIWQICNLELNLQVLHAGESFWMPFSSDILLLITPGTICIFPVYHTLQKSDTLFCTICILLEYWFGVPPTLVILVPPWCTLWCVCVHYAVHYVCTFALWCMCTLWCTTLHKSSAALQSSPSDISLPVAAAAKCPQATTPWWCTSWDIVQ